MDEVLKNLYNYLVINREKDLTEIDCLCVDGVTAENVIQLLKDLESKEKISLDDTYLHCSITVI